MGVGWWVAGLCWWVTGCDVSCRCWGYACVQVWGMLVLWNWVQWLWVGGGSGEFWCVLLVIWES